MLIKLLYALLTNSLQGCTATVLLVWTDGEENFFAQCANVGDSTCIMRFVYVINWNALVACLSFEWVKGRKNDNRTIRKLMVIMVYTSFTSLFLLC